MFERHLAEHEGITDTKLADKRQAQLECHAKLERQAKQGLSEAISGASGDNNRSLSGNLAGCGGSVGDAGLAEYGPLLVSIV